jgi:hypothetical protein
MAEQGMGDDELLAGFLGATLDNSAFHHREHVRVGWLLLQRDCFPDAAAKFCTSLKRIAAAAGKPGLYHETLTIAFLSMIAECMAEVAAGSPGDFESFAAANPGLFEKDALARWYGAERLSSPLARRTFLLPAPMPGAAA